MSLKLTYNGLSKSVGYWVNAYDLSENSIRTRLQQRRNGEELTDEEVIFGKRRAREELPTEAKLMYNGISGSVNQLPQETALSQAINFLSPTWHLRNIGDQLLEAAPGSGTLSAGTLTAHTLATLLALLAPTAAFLAAGFATFLRNETLVLE